MSTSLAFALGVSCAPPPTSPSPPPSGEVLWEAQGGPAETGLALADLDGDGQEEIIVAEGGDVVPGTLRLYHRADAPPLPFWESASTGFYAHLDVGDLDGEGAGDGLAVVVSRYVGSADFAQPGGVDLYRFQAGPGGLEATATEVLSGVYSFGCALGDADGDGDLDLAVATGEAYTARADRLRLLWNTGGEPLFSEDGGWMPAAGWSRGVAWGDVDGDGWLDLAVAMVGEGHRLYRGGPGGSLGDEPDWVAPGEAFEGTGLAWGDFSGDGALDLVVAENAQLTGVGRVRVYCGPALDLCWESAGAREMFSAVALRDLDGDGAAEVLAGVWWGPVRIYAGGSGALWWSAAEDAVAEAVVWGAAREGGCVEVGVSDWDAARGTRLLLACDQRRRRPEARSKR